MTLSIPLFVMLSHVRLEFGAYEIHTGRTWKQHFAQPTVVYAAHEPVARVIVSYLCLFDLD